MARPGPDQSRTNQPLSRCRPARSPTRWKTTCLGFSSCGSAAAGVGCPAKTHRAGGGGPGPGPGRRAGATIYLPCVRFDDRRPRGRWWRFAWGAARPPPAWAGLAITDYVNGGLLRTAVGNEGAPVSISGGGGVGGSVVESLGGFRRASQFARQQAARHEAIAAIGTRKRVAAGIAGGSKGLGLCYVCQATPAVGGEGLLTPAHPLPPSFHPPSIPVTAFSPRPPASPLCL